MIIQILFAGLLSAHAATTVKVENCAPETAGSPFLYEEEFVWGYTRPEMIAKFTEIYQSDKRLKKRAYYNKKTQAVYLPFSAEQGGPVKVPMKFIEHIGMHIEEALKLQYIDGVFFPDMGHSHYFIPQKKWDQVYNPIPVSQFSRMYEKLFADPDLKILYHTAEQLTTKVDKKLVDDVATQWRFYTRNLVGLNRDGGGVRVLPALENEANTLNELKGYFYYGGGFNLSANKNGCFSYQNKGQTYRFDISLYDLAPEHSGMDQ